MTAPSNSIAVAVEVIVTPELFLVICAFLPGRPRWMVEVERGGDNCLVEELRLTVAAKMGQGTPGLLPCLAIQQHNMRALQKLWIVHKQAQYRKNAKLWFGSAMHDAALTGNLEAMEWLHQVTGEIGEPATINRAAACGHARVVRWLLSHLNEYDVESAKRAMAKAAINGHLEVLKTFHEWHADACTAQMMDLAAEYGHLDIIKYLHEETTQQGCTTNAVDKAAENGHLEVVQWLLANRKEGYTEAAMRGAVMNGHLTVVKLCWEEQYLHDDSGDKKSMLIRGMRTGVPHAIRRQYVDVLRYIHKQVGADAFPRFALSFAVDRTRELPAFQFLLSTARPREDIEEALHRAIYSPPIMQYLLQHERFSLESLEYALSFAMCAKDPDVAKPNTLALQIAIAQHKAAADAKSTYFVPTTSTVHTLTKFGPRRKPKARAKAMRACVRPRAQEFLIPSV